MIFEEFKICKICGKPQKSNSSCLEHIKNLHNLTTKEYIIKYFQLPLCQICKINTVELYARPLQTKKTLNRFWHKTCNNKKCISQYNRKIQKDYYDTHEEARELHRKQRLQYLKKKSGKTAWERRAARQMSYLEQWFFDNVIIKHNLTQKYDIVNEFILYPYAIDFAFKNIKLAVELDGKCHFINGQERIEHDKKKDAFLTEQGWKIFRIGYTENNENTINEFLNYISQIETTPKELPNRIFKYKEIKQLDPNYKPKRTWKQYLENQYQKRLKENQPLIELVKNSNVDFSKFGWVRQIAKLINKNPRSINIWMKKYMPDFYQKYCFKRKSK